eukprot:TRINITY_DN31673_c0_g1_i1.p1 TRINITY_DN31673_c0_g1~~TRINITY_DN31673_c0_g1_i1.p1  ORF type:complete len:425 (+),score=116.10 TRINITY_DN31673_c0_g1_i1:54-1277(+)
MSIKDEMRSLLSSTISKLEIAKKEQEFESLFTVSASDSIDAEFSKLDSVLSKLNSDAKEQLYRNRITSLMKTHHSALHKVYQEKESFRNQFIKSEQIRTKVEDVCKELQKQNEYILQEAKKSSEIEQAQRSELAQKFQETIEDVTKKLQDQENDRSDQAHHNDNLKKKLEIIIKQQDTREQLYKAQLGEKELLKKKFELQLAEQMQLAHKQHEKLEELTSKLIRSTKSEQILREQLTDYSTKFESFQGTIEKSNSIFSQYKTQMTELTNMVQMLKKENKELREKTGKSDIAMVKMLEEKHANRKDLNMMKNQRDQLQNMCRTLQHQRAGQRREIQKLKEQVNKQTDGDDAETSESSPENTPSQDLKNARRLSIEPPETSSALPLEPSAMSLDLGSLDLEENERNTLE